MFNYDVMSKEDAENSRYTVLEAGRYPAVFTRQTYKTSQAGNHMFEVDLNVYDVNGAVHFVRDYLVFSKAMMWKIINCAESVGKLQEYQDGKMGDVNLVDCHTIVEIDIQNGKPIPFEKLNGKPDGTLYPPRNVVANYITEEKAAKQASTDAFSDDVPF